MHPDDRSRVLFDPYPESLAKLLDSFLVKRVPLAVVKTAVPNEVRTSVWVDLHSSLIEGMTASSSSAKKVDKRKDK